MKKGGLLRFFVLFFAVYSSAASAAQVQKPDWISGRVYTDQYFGVNGTRSGDFNQSSVSAWLGADYTFQNTFSLKGMTQTDVLFKSIQEPNTTDVRFRVREGYLSWEPTAGAQIRVGQEMIPWGKSDGVNPTDYLTGKDYTLLNPEDEARRVGAFGAHLSFTPNQGNSPYLFEAVLQGNYSKNQMLIPSSSIPSGVTLLMDRDSPKIGHGNTQGAIKFSYLGTRFDFSLSYFDGHEKFPQFFYEGGTTVRAKNILIRAIGGDFSTTLDAYVFRFEGAYTMSEYGPLGYKNQGVTQPNHLDLVVGAERPFYDDFRVNLQFLVRHHPKFASAEAYSGSSVQETLITRQVAAANALILNFQKQTRPGMTFRVGYTEPKNIWSGDLNWVGNLDGSDYLFRPQFSWTKVENLKLTLGADLYGGNPNRPFGSLAPYNAVFFDAKYFF